MHCTLLSELILHLPQAFSCVELSFIRSQEDRGVEISSCFEIRRNVVPFIQINYRRIHFGLILLQMKKHFVEMFYLV